MSVCYRSFPCLPNSCWVQQEWCWADLQVPDSDAVGFFSHPLSHGSVEPVASILPRETQFNIICGCNRLSHMALMRCYWARKQKNRRKHCWKHQPLLSWEGISFLLVCPVRTHLTLCPHVQENEGNVTQKKPVLPQGCAWKHSVRAGSPKSDVSDLLTCCDIQGISSCSL